MSSKKKSSCTAATVTGASEITKQLKNITNEAACKYPAETDGKAIQAVDKFISMADRHYQDGFGGKPYCNEFTYVELIARHGEPPHTGNTQPLMDFYVFCEKMFRDSWKRGRADARAALKHA